MREQQDGKHTWNTFLKFKILHSHFIVFIQNVFIVKRLQNIVSHFCCCARYPSRCGVIVHGFTISEEQRQICDTQNIVIKVILRRPESIWRGRHRREPVKTKAKLQVLFHEPTSSLSHRHQVIVPPESSLNKTTLLL